MSFLSDRVVAEGLTFDDVLLVPTYSDVLPNEVDISSSFSRNIPLQTPMALMGNKTLTDVRNAISMAREGGIGIIDKDLPLDEQIKLVSEVKRIDNGMITDPITITREMTVSDALSLMDEHKIGGIPVIDSNRKLVGIVTSRDLRFEKDLNRPISEVMTSENLITAESSTNLEKATELFEKHKIEKLPIVDKLFRLVGLVTFKDVKQAKDKPLATKDKQGRLRVAAAVGLGSDTFERMSELAQVHVDAIVIDAPHAHAKSVLTLLKKAKVAFPEVDIVVGNIATAEAASELIFAGADALKVGTWPNAFMGAEISGCVGVPMLSAIYAVSKAVRNSGVPILVDAGLQYPGDLVKALAAGAQCVVVGRSPQMASMGELVCQLVGSLRNGMSACGTHTIDKLHEARFIRVTSAGIQESRLKDYGKSDETISLSGD